MLIPNTGFLDNTLREYLLKWTKEQSSFRKTAESSIWPQFPDSWGSAAASEGPEKATIERTCLACVQVCLCTPCKSFHYYRKFLQDPQILFGNHGFKTYPPVNKSFTVKYTQEVSLYLFLSLFSFFGHGILASVPAKKEGIFIQSIPSL